jgi:glucokinase
MEARARQLHERGQRTKLFDLMRKANRDRLTSGVWERALREDDRLAHELIDDAYDAIAAASASVVNLLDIDGIVLGGGLGTRFGANAAERIRAKMRPHIFNPTRDPPVIPAELGDDGGAIGAALLVR